MAYFEQFNWIQPHLYNQLTGNTQLYALFDLRSLLFRLPILHLVPLAWLHWVCYGDNLQHLSHVLRESKKRRIADLLAPSILTTTLLSSAHRSTYINIHHLCQRDTSTICTHEHHLANVTIQNNPDSLERYTFS